MTPRSTSTALGLLLLLSCGAPQRSPEEIVRLYLDLLPRDPIRTLEILTPEFHRAHGLRFAEVGDQPFADTDSRDGDAEEPGEDADLELTRARFGWLTALTKRVFALQAKRFSHRLSESRIEGNRATLLVRVEERGRPPLEALFVLERAGPSRPWKIDAIEKGEVADADLIRAFVLAPDAELNRRILASRGRSAAPRGVRVVVITLDTLRYDALVGADAAMPLLGARAERGALFTRFYAVTPLTQPTHATMFTARQPWEHGLTRNGMDLPDDAWTLAEALRRAGFETRAVVASFPVAARFGFAQGFDTYDDAFSQAMMGHESWEDRPTPGGAFYSRADEITDRALAALDTARGDRQFFWFHYFDPHAPYGSSRGSDFAKWHFFRRLDAGESAESLLTEVRSRYHSDVGFLDTELERLLAQLDAQRNRFETHVLIVSDHGESLGEAGSLGHGFRLSDVEIHVPALLLSARVAPGHRDDVAGSIDVAPTLASLAGLPTWEGGGRDLTRSSVGSERLGMRGTFREPMTERRVDGRGYPLPALLFFSVDAEGRIERGNAGGVEGAPTPKTAARRAAAFAELQAKVSATPGAGELDPEEEQALRALGYVP